MSLRESDEDHLERKQAPGLGFAGTAAALKRLIFRDLAAVNMLLQAWAAAVGQPAHVTSTVAEITGLPPHAFHEWATDHAAEFRA